MLYMALQKYTKEWLEELCKNSYSYAEVLKKAGRKPGGGSQATLVKKIKEFEIDTSHFTGQLWNKGKTKEEDNRIFGKLNEEIFVENSVAYRQTIRKRIITQHLIPYECAFCGNKGEWLGKPLTLELDHINGCPNDHRIENLRFLCPNCHALTPTWRNMHNKDN